MRKLLFALMILACAGWAANIKLYLKDGGYHVVREYQVQPDRIHFYSVERSQWEDIPLELVDLPRTANEAKDRQTKLEADAKTMDEEEKAVRAMEKEVLRIPRDPGAYYILGAETKVMKQAESTLRTDKKRSILKKLSPVPIIEGKGTVELQGAHSQNIVADPEQEFFIQLEQPERYGIAKLTVKGAVRIVESVTTMPITEEMSDEFVMIEILRKQMAENLYKFWPKEKLPPGEYAIVEYSEGKLNTQIWDFAIK